MDDVKIFFNLLFGEYLQKRSDFIEIRGITPKGQLKCRVFSRDIEDIVKHLNEWNNTDPKAHIYFGVCPRNNNKEGKKASIDFITSLWVDIDIGETGHRKVSYFNSKQEAEEFITTMTPEPSIIVFSGYGFHLYWLLKEPVRVEKVNDVENILNGLIERTHGDSGTGDITRILRAPGTFNYKIPENPIPCKVVKIKPDLRYTLEDFNDIAKEGRQAVEEFSGLVDETVKQHWHEPVKPLLFGEIQNRGISQNIMHLIREGDTEGLYVSRSERDIAVIIGLLNKNFSYTEVRRLFANPELAISEKYLEKGIQGEGYFDRTFQSATEYLYNFREKKDRVYIPNETVAITDIALKNVYLTPEMIKQGLGNVLNFAGLEKEETEKVLVYSRKTEREHIEYAIYKGTIDPMETLNLELMRKVYIGLIYYVQQQGSFSIAVKKTSLTKLVIGRKGGKEIRKVETALRLLGNTLFNFLTPQKETQGSLIWLKNNAGNYRVVLNPFYLERMQESGIIEGGYFTTQYLPFPVINSLQEYTKQSLHFLKYKTTYGKRNPRHLNLITHLQRIGVKEWELKDKKRIKEIWTAIKPTFSQAGIGITNIYYPPGKKDDPRSWKLTIIYRRDNGSGASTKIQNCIPTAIVIDMVNYWNSKKIIIHRIYQKFSSVVSECLKNYSPDEIKGAIDNYALVLHGKKFYWTYRWSLDQFLQEANGLEKFLPDNFNETDFYSAEYKEYLKEKNRPGSNIA